MKPIKHTLAALLLAPALASPSPIVSPQATADGVFPITGWSNQHGNFTVVNTGPQAASAGSATYSTASSLFTFQSSRLGLFNVADPFSIPAEIEIDMLIGQDGTVSGNLLAGILTAHDNSGTELLAGYAIEAAALPGAYSVGILFALTYTDPLFAALGNYLTFAGPYPGSWNTFPTPDQVLSMPWARTWGPDSGFTFADFTPTTLVPEPTTLHLAILALITLAFGKRTRKA